MALQTKTVATGDYAADSWSNGFVASLTLTEKRVDIAANTSEVEYIFTISNGNEPFVYHSAVSWGINIGGRDIEINQFKFDLQEGFATQTIVSGTVKVPHNPDGTLEMPYMAYIPNMRRWDGTGPTSMTLQGTWGLTPIPVGAAVFCPDGMIGQSVDVLVTGLHSGLTCTTSYVFRELEGVVAEKNENAVIPWAIPQSFYREIPESKEDICTVFCTYYSGDAPLGTVMCECVMRIDENAVAPVLQGYIEDINQATLALTGSASRLVRYYSNARVTGHCEALEGAHITLYGVTHGGNTYTENPVTIYGVENGLFQFAVEDSRGVTAMCVAEAEVIPYVKLTCNLSDNKPDGNGNMTVKVSGNYFNGSFGAKDNTLWVQYRYKAAGGEYGDWQDMEILPNVRTYNAVATLTDLDYMTAYTFQARAADALAQTETLEYTVKATPVFDWDENDFNVNGSLKINNQPVADYVVEQGTDGIWTWEKWAGGIAKCWGHTGEKSFSFTGDGPVYAGNSVHSVTCPVDLTQVDAVSVNIVSDSACVVPVVVEAGQTIRMSALRLFGKRETVQGYYSIAVAGRWK